MKLNLTCIECKTDVKDGKGWFCTDHYNISGYFCGTCYDKIAHDSYGRPNRPNDYLLMLIKHGVKQ